MPALGFSTNREDTVPHKETLLARIQSYPLAQRLTAALLDEGRGQANAAKIIRSGLTVEDTWIGGSPEEVQEYNEAFEERVRVELSQLGLLDPECDDEVLANIQKVRFTTAFPFQQSTSRLARVCDQTSWRY